MPPTPAQAAPRYVRRPDLDQVDAWESLADGAIRFVAPGYDMNSDEARAADAFMALPPAERAAQVLAWAAARAAAPAPAAVETPAPVADRRTTLDTAEIGAGLRYTLVAVHAQDTLGQPPAFLGTLHVLASADGRALELETNAHELHRKVHLVSGGISHAAMRARALLRWAELLALPQVQTALRLWAAEDNAADYAEGETLSAQDGPDRP